MRTLVHRWAFYLKQRYHNNRKKVYGIMKHTLIIMALALITATAAQAQKKLRQRKSEPCKALLLKTHKHI